MAGVFPCHVAQEILMSKETQTLLDSSLSLYVTLLNCHEILL